MKNRHSLSILKDKSFRSVVQIVGYNHPQQNHHVNLALSRQLLRSGTSIRATVEEALRGQCGKDFISKLAIAAKEARAAGYWLRLIRDTHPHNHPELADLLAQCGELVNMLNSIILNTRRKFAAADSRLQPKTQHSELPDT
ncbi:MAG TPA: four helix bundle protein [Nitrospiraceae bacterium]|nr:four helix bundle protein [Nitrospiraceae bacterium]